MVAVEALMISGETSPRSSPLTSLYGGAVSLPKKDRFLLNTIPRSPCVSAQLHIGFVPGAKIRTRIGTAFWTLHVVKLVSCKTLTFGDPPDPPGF